MKRFACGDVVPGSRATFEGASSGLMPVGERVQRKPRHHA